MVEICMSSRSQDKEAFVNISIQVKDGGNMVVINWLYQNAAAIFISALASLMISKFYFDKANRDGVLTTIIFPIVKILDKGSYNRKNYEELFSISSSYSVKYLRKTERNKLLAMMSSYRAVCKYTKEAADTDCVMSYFAHKLTENGINPKPCAERDEEGNLLFYDFPPEYNYLQDYVYDVISSHEFIVSPNACTTKIAREFQRYTKEYYTDKEINFFDDYSITKVIENSRITREWEEKFVFADNCKTAFLKLPICTKARDIIRESSINEYDKNSKSEYKTFIHRVIAEMKELKNSKYSSIYVVFCLVEQAVVLEILKDIAEFIPNENVHRWVYTVGGLASIFLLLILIGAVEKRAKRQIEEDTLKQISEKKASTDKKKDLMIDCATNLGYMGPLLCLTTWLSNLEGMFKWKWSLIVLTIFLGIGVPVVFRKKKASKIDNDQP